MIIHYCGHRVLPPSAAARFPDTAETAVRERIAYAVGELAPHAAYGSLASGADILIAEAVVARGGALHAVLPFDAAVFITASVASLGDATRDEAWVRRFRDLLAAAADVTALDGCPNDDAAYAACSETAMAAALAHAAASGDATMQIAVWDGQKSGGVAGTFADVERWRGRGGRSLIIAPR